MDVAYFEAPAPGGQPPHPAPGDPAYRPAKEPIVNAPWPVAVLCVGLVALYFIQSRFPIDEVSDALAFSPSVIWSEPRRMITYGFVHGSWAHVLMNAGFILAFGAPVARWFGPSLRGVVGFYVFYLVCGILAAFGFALVHPGQAVPVVGASGAASGLMGAAARMIAGQGSLGPLFSRPVGSMAAAWLAVNVIMAFAGGLLPGAGPAGAAWEAHLAGFMAGVLLVGVFGRLAGRR